MSIYNESPQDSAVTVMTEVKFVRVVVKTTIYGRGGHGREKIQVINEKYVSFIASYGGRLLPSFVIGRTRVRTFT